jgi:uncharacterized protein YdeI (YjbR/CyaY-like superfamily)
MAADDLPVLSFASADAFGDWLRKHHETSAGLWLRIFKKGADEPTVTYAEAVDLALCYGWIDGQKQPDGAHSWLQRFTPRKPGSAWSKRNTEHAERLIQAGRMQPSGQQEIDAAKADDRWERAYDPPSAMTVPEDFLQALKKHQKAAAFFQTLNKANTYAIAYRLRTAKKPETRAKRFAQLLQMMKDGKKLH